MSEPLVQLLKEHDVYLKTWRDRTGMIADDVTEERMKELPYIRTAQILHDWHDFRFVSRHLIGPFPYRIPRGTFTLLLPRIREVLDKADNEKQRKPNPELTKAIGGIVKAILYVFFGFWMVWGCVEWSSTVMGPNKYEGIMVKTPIY